jgi:hypothetical protein
MPAAVRVARDQGATEWLPRRARCVNLAAMLVSSRATSRRVLLMVAALVGFSAVSLAQANGEGTAGQCVTDGTRARDAVIIFGSSSINDFFGHIIEEDVVSLGLRVVRRGLPSAGLARPDFRDVMSELEDLPLEAARAVVLYFGGNDAQALWLRPAERKRPDDTWMKWNDEGWSALYERRVVDLVEAVCASGVPKAIVLAPADVARDALQARLDRIRDLQRTAASRTSCGRFVATSGRNLLSPGGEGLYAADGIHMSRVGAQVLWERLRVPIMELVR